MGLIGLEAIYRKPRTNDAQPDHHVYPYLLRELKIDPRSTSPRDYRSTSPTDYRSTSPMHSSRM